VTHPFAQLKRNQQRGSKPRCHQLTQGSPQIVATRLNALAAPFASIAPTDHWMPQGFDQTDEATLPEAAGLLAQELRTELKRWWLAVASGTTRTPNWDIASTCTVAGRHGILLVEAKAHAQELIKEETGRKSIEAPVSASARRNLLRIEWALRDASIALSDSTGLPWSLSRDWNYQMANRFAWSWKLAELGVPVVLVYLGFLKANDMSKPGEVPFADATDWSDLVRSHSASLFPGEVWDRNWSVNGVPLIPLIRSIEVPLGPDAQS
jgi:hypothetical protein